ncbi:Translocator protein [Seminavis robusta]|uniref:Translocator protein n=1 Tax=Seminavis robusta TaxID=568900 RepID=A0A9N8E5H8_9STRA|nr:Translocator protein [Seminavis robusta]|eukprot:Sro538_g162470.1 Translocator protein (296) ;mRNA; r:4137-5024
MKVSGCFLSVYLALLLPTTAALWAPRPDGLANTVKLPLYSNFRTRPVAFPDVRSSSALQVSTGHALRGGGCSDTSMTLFLKVGVSAILQAISLLGVLRAGKEVSDKVSAEIEQPKLPQWLSIKLLPQWLSIGVVVFASSIFGSLVDGGMSAATQQFMDPNVVPGDPNWYSNLVKPVWNPPGWLFPIMWLLVSKPTQAIALNKVLKNDDKEKPKFRWKALGVYCAHLALGDAWNKVFFGFQCIGRGTAVITTFFGALLTSTKLFYDLDPEAGKFMLPTCGWVAVATALNWSIYFKN